MTSSVGYDITVSTENVGMENMAPQFDGIGELWQFVGLKMKALIAGMLNPGPVYVEANL